MEVEARGIGAADVNVDMLGLLELDGLYVRGWPFPHGILRGWHELRVYGGSEDRQS